MGGTLNSRLAASPLVRLVEGEERCGPLATPRIFFLKIGHIVTCMVLTAKANDRRKILALSRDEFRGPQCDFVRQVALVPFYEYFMGTTFGLEFSNSATSFR
ncbi:hypothetical protein TNCV_4419511 [Trichonephila clavipes]|nr:hypothetical protein TNCV_4419511 [Trichonephila clavipes]